MQSPPDCLQFMTFDVHQHFGQVQRLLDADTPFVVATMVAVRGSAPQVLGAKAIVTAEGIVGGTVGGGKVEAFAIQHAQQMLDAQDGLRNELCTWNLQTDIRMTCGGEVTFFFEVFACKEWRVCVFGAGHIAQSFVPLLTSLNCTVTCIDQRSDWVERLPDHPRLTKIVAADLPSQVSQQRSDSFFVLMTQGHATDLPVLVKLLEGEEPPYVGVLGSLQKAKVLRRDLAELGISREKIDSFCCPMGKPLGNNTPAEISISIVSQLIEERDRLGIIDHKTKKF